jgi:hypothetical protein
MLSAGFSQRFFEQFGLRLQLAGQIPLCTEVQTFPLADANRALLALKRSEIHGAGALRV